MDEPVVTGAGGCFLFAGLVIHVFLMCMLAKRLGYTPATGLLALIPCVGHILLFVWAFSESPNEKQLHMLRARHAQRGEQQMEKFLGKMSKGTTNDPGSFLSQLEEE